MTRVQRPRNLSQADHDALEVRVVSLSLRWLKAAADSDQTRCSALGSLILRHEIELGNCAPVL